MHEEGRELREEDREKEGHEEGRELREEDREKEGEERREGRK